jgi:hypothetical protein
MPVFLQYLPVGILRIILNSFRYAIGKIHIDYDTFDEVYQDIDKNISLNERNQCENIYIKKAFDEIQHYMNKEIDSNNPIYYELSKDKIPVQLLSYLNITRSMKRDHETAKTDDKTAKTDYKTDSLFIPSPTLKTIKTFPGLETMNKKENENESNHKNENNLELGDENHLKSTSSGSFYGNCEKIGVHQYKEGGGEGNDLKEGAGDGVIRLSFEQFVSAALSAALSSSTPIPTPSFNAHTKFPPKDHYSSKERSPSQEYCTSKEHSSFASLASHPLPFPSLPTQQNPYSLEFKFPIQPGQPGYLGQSRYLDQPGSSIVLDASPVIDTSASSSPPTYAVQPGYLSQSKYSLSSLSRSLTPLSTPSPSPSLSTAPFLPEMGLEGLEGFSFHPAASIRNSSSMGEGGSGAKNFINKSRSKKRRQGLDHRWTGSGPGPGVTPSSLPLSWHPSSPLLKSMDADNTTAETHIFSLQDILMNNYFDVIRKGLINIFTEGMYLYECIYVYIKVKIAYTFMRKYPCTNMYVHVNDCAYVYTHIHT